MTDKMQEKPLLTSDAESKSKNSEKWFAVRTKSRFEKKMHKQLLDLDYTAFLPLETTYRMWSDRRKKVQVPLIPSFVFVKNPAVNKAPIYKLPGFSSILKVNGKIGEITAEEIEHLRILTSDEIDFEQYTFERFEKGEAVEVMAGPFAGMWANAIEDVNNFRLLIEIKSLGIGYKVNVPKNKVRRIKSVR